MTTVNRSPDAVFDRHLAAWEQRVETAARAAFDFAEQEDWPEDQRATWDELWPNARSFWRRLAAAALTADAETRDGDDEAAARIHLGQAGAMASFADDLEREGEARAAVMADQRAAFYREWAAEPSVVPPEIEDPPAAQSDDEAVGEDDPTVGWPNSSIWWNR